MEVTKYGEGFYILDDGRVREFLITGSNEALLIDTGFGDSGTAEEVRRLTDLPLKVILTHGDIDHAGGLSGFGECWIHPEDAHMIPRNISVHDLHEGEHITAGVYDFEVIHIPGHTYGSIALLDRKRKLLLPGDTVQKDGPIFMFGENRNLDLYIESLGRLLDLVSGIEVILPSHHGCPISPDHISYCLEDAVELKKGNLEGKDHPSLPCKSFRGKWTEFYF